MILAHTDVRIHFLAGIEPVASRMASYLAQDQIETTAVTGFELLSGGREGDCGDRVRRLVAALPVLPLDRGAAAQAARVRQQLETAGHKIGMADSLITGIALEHGLPPWTRNRQTLSGSMDCGLWRGNDSRRTALAPVAETARQHLRQAKSANTRRGLSRGLESLRNVVCLPPTGSPTGSGRNSRPLLF